MFWCFQSLVAMQANVCFVTLMSVYIFLENLAAVNGEGIVVQS